MKPIRFVKDRLGRSASALTGKPTGFDWFLRGAGNGAISAAALVFGLQFAAGAALAHSAAPVKAEHAPLEAVAMAPSSGFLNLFDPAVLLGGLGADPGARQETIAQDAEADDVAYGDDNDPLEPINRVVFDFNNMLDQIIAEPTARLYRQFPQEMRISVSNAFANLRSPITLANDVLQGEWERANTTANRLLINSTLGIGGLYDPALEMGFEPHVEDFDQTMALAGISPGPYLMLPILGPVSARHALGLAVDSLAHPLTWVLAGQPLLVQLAPKGAELISEREKYLDPIAEIRTTSPDYYAAIRSLYRQSRMSAISNGRIDPEQPTESHDEIDFDF